MWHCTPYCPNSNSSSNMHTHPIPVFSKYLRGPGGNKAWALRRYICWGRHGIWTSGFRVSHTWTGKPPVHSASHFVRPNCSWPALGNLARQTPANTGAGVPCWYIPAQMHCSPVLRSLGPWQVEKSRGRNWGPLTVRWHPSRWSAEA